MNQEELKKQKEDHVTKIFWLGLHISFIFAIPAVIGVFVGRQIDDYFQTGNKLTTIILFFTFFFSWFLVLMKYNKLNKKLKEINKKIKEDKQG